MSLAALAQDPDAAEQAKIVADVRAKALEYARNGPNFICTQVNRHNVDASGTNTKWKLLDTIHERLTFTNAKDEYEVLSINGKRPGNPERRPEGLMAMSEMNEVLADIFDPKAKGTITWTKTDSLRGHRVNELAYKILKENSSMTIGKKDLTVGLFGLLDADADTGAVLRIANVLTDIPKKYPQQAVSMDLNWDYMKLGNGVALVPIKADMHEKDGKSLVWNEIEFRDFQPGQAKTAAR